MKYFWSFSLIAVAALMALVLQYPNVVPFVAADQTNTTSSQVIVTGIVDATINCSSISFGSLSPNTANQSATNACNMTINANTNTVTTMSINASALNSTAGAVVLDFANMSYSNNSGTAGTCSSVMAAGFFSGACGQGNATTANYSDWVSIPDPSTAVYALAFFNITIPALQSKGTYNGQIYMKLLDVG